MAETGGPLRVVSWNVHRARGNDGVVDPLRTVDVLLSEVLAGGTDLLVLQEADAEAHPQTGLLDLDRIARETGLVHAHPERDWRWSDASHGFHGVILLAGAAVRITRAWVLDLPGHCHRGAVVIEADCRGQMVRAIGTHLSLWQPLRMAQMRIVGQYLARHPVMPTVLVGDLNEWRPWGGLALSRKVLGRALTGPAPATFPVARPLLPLDRVLAGDGARVDSVRVPDGPGIRAASDHRPLIATVRVDAPAVRPC